MPRNGSGIYSKVAGTTAVSGATIESSKYNAQVDDQVADANAARPVIAGGTGATDASAARVNLGVPTALDDVTAVLGSTLTYTAGQFGTVEAGDYVQTRAEGFSYQVAASSATDHHLTTAGGVKLYVLPGADGSYNVKAFGALGDGSTDDRAAIAAAIAGARDEYLGVQYTDNGNPLAFTNAIPYVWFPTGEYRVSSAIDVTGYVSVHLKGSGKAFIQGDRNVAEKTLGFLTAGDASTNGNLRYLTIEGIQFQNFDELISANTSNLDMSRWLFRLCQFDAINLILNSHTYAKSRSTICTFDQCIFQYKIERITRVFFDKLNFNDCWIGWGDLSTDVITANSLVKLDGCMLIPSGSSATAKSLVRLIDNDGTGVAVTSEALRGVHIVGCRASNEGGQGPLVVNDYAVQNVDNAVSPQIHIDSCALTGVIASLYDPGDSEVGLVHCLKWPASVKFSSNSFRTLGATTGALVSKSASLVSDAPESFLVDMDDSSYSNAQRVVGEATGRRIARSLRGYIRNPAPHNLRGAEMWEDGHIPVVDTATTGQKKATFYLRSGFVSGLSRFTPLTFTLYLGGQGITNATDSFLYAGVSTYRISIIGANVSGNLMRIKATKISGDTWGAANASNCDVISAHFGTADTGSTTSSNIAGDSITIAFGANVSLGRARLVPGFGKLHRYGDVLTG